MSENVREKKLTGAQRAALDALASGASRDQAADAADRTRRTLDRWIDGDPAFQRALNEASEAAIADAARRLNGLLRHAVNAIAYVLQHPDEPGGHARLRAAQMTIDAAVKLRELTTIHERLARLEDRIL